MASSEGRVANDGPRGKDGQGARMGARAGSGPMRGPTTVVQIFNLSNPQTMPYRKLLSLVNEAGVPVRMLPFEQWRQQLMTMAQQFGGESWNPFLPLLDEITAEQVFMPTFDHSHTLQGLAGTGVTCPPVGPELLQTYLKFFSRVVG